MVPGMRSTLKQAAQQGLALLVVQAGQRLAQVRHPGSRVGDGHGVVVEVDHHGATQHAAPCGMAAPPPRDYNPATRSEVPSLVLLEGKKLLITGVLTDDSMAFAVAKVAQEAGAEVLLTSVGRAMSLTQRVAKKLDPVPDVMDMDVNNDEQIAAVAAEVSKRWGRLDGALHSIGFMPQDALGGNFMTTPWESVATGFQTSAFSLKALGAGLLEPMKAADATPAW